MEDKRISDENSNIQSKKETKHRKPTVKFGRSVNCSGRRNRARIIRSMKVAVVVKNIMIMIMIMKIMLKFMFCWHIFRMYSIYLQFV
jgi:hypothetical protein